jgi:hypothetical protein
LLILIDGRRGDAPAVFHMRGMVASHPLAMFVVAP